MGKLIKKGELAKTQEGEPVIVDGEGKGIKANELVIGVWLMCDNIEEDELINTIAEKTGEPKDKIEGPIKQLIGDLVKVGLVEVTE